MNYYIAGRNGSGIHIADERAVCVVDVRVMGNMAAAMRFAGVLVELMNNPDAQELAIRNVELQKARADTLSLFKKIEMLANVFSVDNDFEKKKFLEMLWKIMEAREVVSNEQKGE